MTEVDRWDDSRLIADQTKEILSPSGRYRMILRYYGQGKQHWSYSRGTVYRISDGDLVCDIKRNYSTFSHSFVMKGGQEWLIGGRSYMRPTIVNLDEGKEYEFEEPGPHQFCWVKATLSPDENTLIVDGCYWACPYEYKFYDFTNPSEGWPNLPVVELADWEKDGPNAKPTYVSSDEKPFEFDGDKVICYESEDFYIPTGQRENDIRAEDLEAQGEAADDKNNWRREVDLRATLQRRGDVMVIEEVWLSEHRKEENRVREEYEAKEKAQKKEWCDTDLLWAALSSSLGDDLKLSMWWKHPSWNDRAAGEKNPAFFHPVVKREGQPENRSAHLTWGVLEGPLVAELWERGKGSHDEVFDRSVEGLHRALDTIRTHLKETP